MSCGCFRVEYRTVTLIFGATLGLVILTTAASILATAALGLIAFVPLVGLAALPLQLLAWLVRGIVFQFIALTAVVAYLGVYRGMREGRARRRLGAARNPAHRLSIGRLGLIDHQAFLSSAARDYQESAIRKTGALAASVPDLISFAAGYPAAEMFPWEPLQAVAAELLASRDGNTLQYGATRGYRPLVEQVIALLAGRGIAAGLDEVIITTGSQQGLDLCGPRADRSRRCRARRAADLQRRHRRVSQPAGGARRRRAGRRRTVDRRARRGRRPAVGRGEAARGSSTSRRISRTRPGC